MFAAQFFAPLAAYWRWFLWAWAGIACLCSPTVADELAVAEENPTEVASSAGSSDGMLPAGGIRAAVSPADLERLEAIYEHESLKTSAQSPKLSQYVQDFGNAVNGWLSGWSEGWAPLFSSRLTSAIELLAKATFLFLLGFLLITGIRLLLARLEERVDRGEVLERSEMAEPISPIATKNWEDEFNGFLRNGDVSSGLRAFWWWLAHLLVQDRVDPTWTSRELLRRSGRWDLLPLMRRLDRMTYGETTPSVAEVMDLRQDLRNYDL